MPTPAQLGLDSDIWLSLRGDQNVGTGTLDDPYDASVFYEAVKNPTGSLTLGPGHATGQEVTVPLTSHGYADGDVVRVQNAVPSGYNGTFVIYGVVTNVSFKYFVYVGPGTYTSGAQFQRLTYRFDTVMAVTLAGKTNFRVNLGPGVFETRGYYAGAPSSYWKIKPGMRIQGAGIDVTTIKLVSAHVLGQAYLAIGMQLSDAPITGFEASDFTVDANIDNQPRLPSGGIAPYFAPVSCAALFAVGSHTRIRRIRAINFGTQTPLPGLECFVISVAGAQVAQSQKPIDCVVEDCIVEKPGTNNFRETTCIATIGGPNATGVRAYHTASVVRNCIVNCDFQYQSPRGTVPSKKLGISTLTSELVLGSYYGVLTTQNDVAGQPVPHNRVVGQNIKVAGVITSPTSPNLYNEVFRVTSNVSSNQLKFLIGPTPPGSVDGPLIGRAVGGVTFQAISIDGGIGAIAESNRVYGLNSGIYHDSYSTRDIVVRGNYFYAVGSGIAQNMGINTPFTVTTGNLTQIAKVATYDTVSIPHGLLAGEGVRVSANVSSPAQYIGFFVVKAVPTIYQFQYDLATDPGGTPPTGEKFGQIWQIGSILAFQNTCELNTRYALAFGPSVAFYIVGILFEDTFNPTTPTPQTPPPYVFADSLVQRNIVRILNGANDTTARTTDFARCLNVLVYKNVLNLSQSNSIHYNGTFCSPAVTILNNQTTSGVVVNGTNP